MGTCLQSLNPSSQLVAPVLLLLCAHGEVELSPALLWVLVWLCFHAQQGGSPWYHAHSSLLSVRDLRGFRASEMKLNWVTLSLIPQGGERQVTAPAPPEQDGVER